MPGVRVVVECLPSGPGAVPGPPAAGLAVATPAAELPQYLETNYWWAYLRPASLWIFDRTPVVSAILWGHYRKLSRAALAEIKPGDRVLQMACVYGDLSPQIARAVGPQGQLDIIDIAPIQVENARRHLAAMPWASVRVMDAARPTAEKYDVVLCFFLLHELPEPYKRAVVNSALQNLRAHGRAVFIDYHRPALWHPLRPVQALVFGLFEPFAKRLWHTRITEFASQPGRFRWRKNTWFGGFYQKLVTQPAKYPD